MKRILSLALLSFSAASCSYFQDNATNSHNAVCNQLKSQIIYGGATPQNEPRATANQPLATQQRAQLDKANANYNQLGC